MPLRVVFADDNYLAREGVSALLAEGEGIEVVGTAADPDSLMRSVAEHLPDVVLTDIRMPPTQTDEGIEAALRIRAEHPGVGVVVLSQYVEEDYAFTLLADGAEVSATCSRRESVTSTRSRVPCTKWRGAGLCSTPWSSTPSSRVGGPTVRSSG